MVTKPPPVFSDALRALALEAAIAQARKSLSEGGIPIGGALINEAGEIVAVGHNMRVQAGDPTAHGETVCIRNAGRRRDWKRLLMATTLSPCAMCSGTTVLHQIPVVVIGENENFQGREDWLRAEGIEVQNANNAECIRLMREFREKHPDLWEEDIGDPD